MRRKRHELTYEAGVLISLSEAQKSFTDAISLVKKILEIVKGKNPQMKLDF